MAQGARRKLEVQDRVLYFKIDDDRPTTTATTRTEAGSSKRSVAVQPWSDPTPLRYVHFSEVYLLVWAWPMGFQMLGISCAHMWRATANARRNYELLVTTSMH